MWQQEVFPFSGKKSVNVNAGRQFEMSANSRSQ
jgi:hypothetical protein